MIKVALIGAAGYTAKEFLELITRHEYLELDSIVSDSLTEGTTINSIWPRLSSRIEKKVQKKLNNKVDEAVLAKSTSESQKYAAELLAQGIRVVDLSAAFRLKDVDIYEKTYAETHQSKDLLADAVYGMPEIYRTNIREANLIANPGCYATSVILGSYPLFFHKIVDPKNVNVSAYSGISGAGIRNTDSTYSFVERNENITPYKILGHRHVPEINQELSSASESDISIAFVPHLAPLNKGISSTIFLEPKDSNQITATKIHQMYKEFYASEPFVRVLPLDNIPSISNVVSTNYCDVGIFYSNELGKIVISSVLDNMVKGAVGQAIQNINIMFGLEEKTGL